MNKHFNIIWFNYPNHNGEGFHPAYLTIVDGNYMISSNLYDATKFRTLRKLNEHLKFCEENYDCEVDIIKIDKKVFGDNPRFIY